MKQMNKEEADKAAKLLGRQIIDEILVFFVLLFTWFFRGSLQNFWSMAGVVVLVLILGADYVIHNPKLAAKRAQKRKAGK